MVDDASPTDEKLALRRRLGQRMMPAGWEFVPRGIPFGPRHYHESAVGLALSVPGALQALREAGTGFDAAIMGCFVDSAVREARVAARIPVIGPGQSSIALAQTLGDRFGVVTVLPSNVPDIERLIAGMQSGHLSTGVAAICIEPDAVNEGHDQALERTEGQARLLVERGAQVIILGCLSYSFGDFSAELTRRLGLPVVDPLKAAIAVAMAQVSMGVCPSRRAHPPLEAEAELHAYLDDLAALARRPTSQQRRT
jgi:allantoin racemase